MSWSRRYPLFLLVCAVTSCAVSNIDKAITHQTAPATRGWFVWRCPSGYTLEKPQSWTATPECIKE